MGSTKWIFSCHGVRSFHLWISLQALSYSLPSHLDIFAASSFDKPVSSYLDKRPLPPSVSLSTARTEVRSFVYGA